MHWYIPTETEAVGVGGTFFANACLAEGSRGTENPKKITCKRCKLIFAHPTTAAQAAAKLVQHVIAEQESGRQDYSIEVKCNSCDQDLDVFGWYESVEQHDLVRRAMHFLGHVAYDHAWGADVLLTRMYTFTTAYELNFAMGKATATMNEDNWRERNGLVCR